MFTIKKLFIAAVFLIPTIHYGQHTDQINSNRPGESMSAFAVGKTVIQIETGVFGIQESHSLPPHSDANGFGIDVTLRYGLFLENLELVADVQYVNQTVNSPMRSMNIADFKQTVLGAKYLIYDPNKNYKKEPNLYSWKANHSFDWHQLIPAVSVFAGANFIFTDNPYSYSLGSKISKLPESSISPKFTLITQNHLGDGRWVFVTNITSDYITTDYPSLSYILTLTRGISDKWSAFVENQGINSDIYSDAILRGGAAYLINKNLQVDASISTNFKDTPSILYGGVGVSWRYDGRYKEVHILSKEEKAAEKMAKKTNSRKQSRKSK